MLPLTVCYGGHDFMEHIRAERIMSDYLPRRALRFVNTSRRRRGHKMMPFASPGNEHEAMAFATPPPLGLLFDIARSQSFDRK